MSGSKRKRHIYGSCYQSQLVMSQISIVTKTAWRMEKTLAIIIVSLLNSQDRRQMGFRSGIHSAPGCPNKAATGD